MKPIAEFKRQGPPASPKVKAVEDKFAEALALTVEAIDAPDGILVFDIVMAAAASVLMIGVENLDKRTRRAMLTRFEEHLKNQQGRARRLVMSDERH